LAVGVDDRVAALIPFRGPGGVHGGSFRYYSAIDVIKGALPADALRGRIVLVGTSAPGLLDMRVTPVGETYPGVETHANLIAGLLDGKIPVRPDYALGYEVVLLAMTGVMLAICLPLVSALRAVVLTVGVLIGLVGLNVWLFLGYGLVMPLASALTLTLIVFGVHMSYGYFVESRSKRELAHLFGTYVPPELVDEMVKDPDRYTMQAEARELTVMFCDMRGFTTLSEGMAPVQLQALLNEVFSRLTNIIRQHRGTVDKYMGDCVMAFWGAPVPAADHAQQATQAALAMAREVVRINEEHAAAGLSAIRVGIGYATGVMCVGDMGSDVRRSYTVIGDVVNLASRLEGLSKLYGVDIVASESARRQAAHGVWQELDRVRVKGKAEAVTIFTPLPDPADARTNEEVRTWQHFLKTYREQDWEQAELHLLNLRRLNANKVLYQLYAERVVLRKLAPFDPSWDGTTDFDHK
jgi:adenylate cyclase